MKLSKKGEKYELDFRFKDRRFRIVAFQTEKASLELWRLLEKLMEIRHFNSPVPIDLQRTIEALPSRVFKAIEKGGFLTAGQTAAKSPLAEQIAAFIEMLKSKRVCQKYRLQTERKLKKMFSDCGFEVLTDINSQRFIRYTNDLNAAVKTKKDTIAVMKSFSKWLFETGILPKDDFKLVKLPKVLKSDQVHPRRALTADEVARLIYAAENGQPYRNISGRERALIYRVAVESGLRFNEIKTLKVNSFDFDSCTVRIEDSNEKARRGCILPLKKTTAEMIKDFLRRKSPQATAFNVKKGYLLMQVDLAAADIPYELDGQFADFHSLRHTTASLLIGTGANIKAIQTIMRHSTADLTLSKYSHIYTGQQRETIEALPDFVYQENQAVKTGTFDNENSVQNSVHNYRREPSKSDNFASVKITQNHSNNAEFSEKPAFYCENRQPSFLAQKSERQDLNLSSEFHNSLSDKALAEKDKNALSKILSKRQSQSCFSSDLQTVIDHWNILPDSIKATIRNLISPYVAGK